MPPTTRSQDVAILLGRALLAWLFIPAGWSKLNNFAGVVNYIAAKDVPLPEVCAAMAIAAELGLGLLVLVGWQARWAALGLAIFVAAITPIFHNYWALPPAEAVMQKQAFNKNLGVVGGLLLLAAFGAGGWSADARRRRPD